MTGGWGRALTGQGKEPHFTYTPQVLARTAPPKAVPVFRGVALGPVVGSCPSGTAQ
jgi:hypothetical protein